MSLLDTAKLLGAGNSGIHTHPSDNIAATHLHSTAENSPFQLHPADNIAVAPVPIAIRHEQ